VIITIGSINLDLISTVARLPRPGETIPATGFRTAPGGKGANQALAARRAGSAVQMVGAVGRDAFAAEATELLSQAGVDLSAVHPVDATTGTATILVDNSGENVIVVAAGANGALRPDNLAAIGMKGGDVVLLQHEVPLATVEAALRAADAAGATAILNTAPFISEATPLLALAAIVVANETEFDLYAEAMDLEGDSRQARMEAFHRRTGKTLIVTLGADGALGVTANGAIQVPTIPIKPVDTVGAGDTFCGVLAAGLHEGLAWEQAMRRAAVAGALACLKAGAQPSIPTAAEIDHATETLA
jgi:ribokinase